MVSECFRRERAGDFIQDKEMIEKEQNVIRFCKDILYHLAYAQMKNMSFFNKMIQNAPVYYV